MAKNHTASPEQPLRRSERLRRITHHLHHRCTDCAGRCAFKSVGLQKTGQSLAACAALHRRATWRHRLWRAASLGFDAATVGLGLFAALSRGDLSDFAVLGLVPLEGVGSAVLALRLLEYALAPQRRAEAARGPMRLFGSLRLRIAAALDAGDDLVALRRIQGYLADVVRTADPGVLEDLNTELNQADLLEFLLLSDAGPGA